MTSLPYWDYQAIPILPESFFDPASPLYHPGRGASAGFDFAQSRWQVEHRFADLVRDRFEMAVGRRDVAGTVEAFGHNTIHGRVGGDMGSLDRSPLDPIFWLHHCNIDRVFSTWQAKQAPARAYPTAWLNESISGFVRPNGPVSPLRVRALVEAADLGYSYEAPYEFPVFAVPIVPPEGRTLREAVSSVDYSGEVRAAGGEETLRLVLSDAAMAAIRADSAQALDIEGTGVVRFAASGLGSRIVRVAASAPAAASLDPVAISASVPLLHSAEASGEGGPHGSHGDYGHCFSFGVNLVNLIGRSRGDVVLTASAEPGSDQPAPGRPRAISLEYRLRLTTTRWV